MRFTQQLLLYLHNWLSESENIPYQAFQHPWLSHRHQFMVQRATAVRLAELCKSMQRHMATYFRQNMENAETNHSCCWLSLCQPRYPWARPQIRWRSTALARTPEVLLSQPQRWCSLWHWQVLWDHLRPVLWSPWWWQNWPFHAVSVTEKSHLTGKKTRYRLWKKKYEKIYTANWTSD